MVVSTWDFFLCVVISGEGLTYCYENSGDNVNKCPSRRKVH